MNIKMKIICLVILITGFIPVSTNPCTTFCIKDKYGNIFFGRNYDFATGLGHIQINLRDIEKTSFIVSPEKPFTWASKYGSISFNQFGREFPNGGMNEAGLVVELMMLDETIYPQLDDRYGLEELQWIQYQLDVSATVEEVVNSDKLIRISYTSQAPIHFLVADAKGNVAVIEYLNGKMIYYTGKDLKYPVLANEPYQTGLYFKKKFNANKARFQDQRFVKASTMIESIDQNTQLTVDICYDILNYVSQGEWTRWNIVYDIKNKQIYYKTGANRAVKKLTINQFDYSGSSKRLYLDIDQRFSAISDFKEYSYESNLKLIDQVFTGLEGFLKDLPYKEIWAKYPDEINMKETRKLQLPAAKYICDLLRIADYETAKPDIQKIIDSKDEYYFAEPEFYYQVSTKLTNKKEKEIIEVLKILVEHFPKSSKAYSALAKAYIYIGNKQLAKENFEKALAIDPQNSAIKWTFDNFKAIENPLKLDEATQKSYTGIYRPRKITLEKGQLYYQREGGTKMKMIPMTKDIFVFKEVEYFRLKIILENGNAVAIEGLYNDGTSDKNARTD